MAFRYRARLSLRLGYENASLEKDAIIADLLRDNQARVEAIFLQALARAQKQAELSRNDDPAALAHFFVVTIQGMRAMARLTSLKRALEQVAGVALGVFNSSHPKHEKN
jgi:TetR/AcrR family transcriptional regulator, transcriptional repressor for nem operon